MGDSSGIMAVEWFWSGCVRIWLLLSVFFGFYFFLLFVLKEKKLVLSINKVGCQVVVAGDRRVK